MKDLIKVEKYSGSGFKYNGFLIKDGFFIFRDKQGRISAISSGMAYFDSFGNADCLATYFSENGGWTRYWIDTEDIHELKEGKEMLFRHLEEQEEIWRATE